MRHRWLPAVLARIHELAAQRKVDFTIKADARHVLANLAASDFAQRLVSKTTGEWMDVFKPAIGEVIVYVKVILRSDCVVISFHQERDQSDEDN